MDLDKLRTQAAQRRIEQATTKKKLTEQEELERTFAAVGRYFANFILSGMSEAADAGQTWFTIWQDTGIYLRSHPMGHHSKPEDAIWKILKPYVLAALPVNIRHEVLIEQHKTRYYDGCLQEITISVDFSAPSTTTYPECADMKFTVEDLVRIRALLEWHLTSGGVRRSGVDSIDQRLWNGGGELWQVRDLVRSRADRKRLFVDLAGHYANTNIDVVKSIAKIDGLIEQGGLPWFSKETA
jgi:hypothetical protein